MRDYAAVDGGTAIEQVPRKTLAGAVGIARGEGAVPSDEDVKRWIEEERISKYGERGGAAVRSRRQ